MKALSPLTLVAALALTAMAGATAVRITQAKETKKMELGNFSLCLTVKDIKASKAFYEKLDFKEVAGDMKQNWIVLQNGTTKIGLFQGFFDKNVMTFNPGWTSDKQQTLKDFQDVRELQSILKKRGIKLETEADASTKGPASFTLADPDGNPIYVDQHVPSPER